MKPTISFEFFPPKTQKGADNLIARIKNDFMPLNPSYVSMTFGAGGSTQNLTKDTILRMKAETPLKVVSHLTCVGMDKDQIKTLLDEYNELGIHDILALRGDPPNGGIDFTPPENGFTYAAELVCFIKTNYPHMNVGVAGFPEGHPATPNRLVELDNLKKKVDCGADYICTQLFFDNRDFYDFRERCELAGIKVPIKAGIMPVVSKSNMERIAELSLGARIPAGLIRAMNRAATDDAAERVGIHWATHQSLDLLENNVSGIHFYTLNKSRATLEIFRFLGIEEAGGI
ncbi:MAG: methylenetetrahydrofolate reductase [NAD(P)H] [Spirochaetales bacterium]|uniref:Methylenetetrahydrofolate reductase n=1 Tax=Candidatus Thalassospirochaeta sargassi TaxID=3119039 RepID=A0AAJ1IEX8_9SPIO|nr:methylenetetrahydrofolate reductase [NAD(P)H] [Spirochaetales bacterium]